MEKIQHLIDFVYYFIFQASRKNKFETDHHFKTTTIITFMCFIYLGFLTMILAPIGWKFNLKIPPYWLVIALLLPTAIFCYKVSLWYPKKGKRFFIIKEFDNKYTYKNQPKAYDFLAMFGLFLLSFFMAFVLSGWVNNLLR